MSMIAGLREGQGRTWTVTISVAVVALAVAVVGAMAVGSGGGIDPVNLFVEGKLSGNSQEFLGGLIGGTALFAFAAGMASAVNPCGFAMLPAYLGLYLGSNLAEEQQPRSGGCGVAWAGGGRRGIRRVHPAIRCSRRRGGPVGVVHQRPAALAGG